MGLPACSNSQWNRIVKKLEVHVTEVHVTELAEWSGPVVRYNWMLKIEGMKNNG